jgi:hypothetical protein
MKKYLICLFILAILLGLSCTTPPAATTPAAATPPPAVVTPPPPPPPPLIAGLDMSGATEYTIIPGDFLSEITRRVYSHLTNVGPAGTRNGFYFPVLMLASEGQITDPDLIFPGTKLNIPNLERNLANPDSRRAIKNILAQVAVIYSNRHLPDEADGLNRLADWL